jgi:hypothetical protein
LLTIASLLSILFLSFHLADDIVRGFEKGGLANLTAVPICVVWLYATLMLTERRSGYVIILLGSLLGMFVPYVHMKGRGVGIGSSIYGSRGGFFFIWILLLIGVTSLFSAILTLRGLWRLRRGRLSSS